MDYTRWSDSVASLADEVVLSVCSRYGEEALRWRAKFLGMLPEVEKRKLYLREGCSSVVEFAKKVGGVSEEQVRRVLRVEEDLRDKPQLHELLVSGEVSINKLAKIHTVATSENQEMLANQVQMLSARAVETLARDIRTMSQIIDTSKQISFGHVPSEASLWEESPSQHTLELSEEVRGRLSALKNKGIDINELLMELLDQREQAIQKEKEEIAKVLQHQDKPETRYIPARTRKVLAKEYGTKCSRTGCNKPARDLHHQKRWSLDPTHDPHYLAPLCEEHHEIAHTIDLEYQTYKKGKQ